MPRKPIYRVLALCYKVSQVMTKYRLFLASSGARRYNAAFAKPFLSIAWRGGARSVTERIHKIKLVKVSQFFLIFRTIGNIIVLLCECIKAGLGRQLAARAPASFYSLCLPDNDKIPPIPC